MPIPVPCFFNRLNFMQSLMIDEEEQIRIRLDLIQMFAPRSAANFVDDTTQ